MGRNRYKASGFKGAGGCCCYGDKLLDLKIVMFGPDLGVCGACVCTKAVAPYSQGVV